MKITRRDFLAATAGGVLVAPQARGRTPRTSSAAAYRLDRPVVAPSDFEYAGVLKVPAAVSGFSYGALAARTIASHPSFFMPGHRYSNDAVFEFSPPRSALVRPGASRPDIGNLPRPDVTTVWGDIYKGRKTSWLPDGSVKDAGAWWTGGLAWFADRLYWVYGDDYNVRGSADFSLGMTSLGAPPGSNAMGPWRLNAPSHQTQGYLVEIPAAFSADYCPGARLAAGSSLVSGNVSASWGPVLHAFVPPIDATPAGRNSPMIPVTTLVGYSLDHRLKRDPNYVFHYAPEIPPQHHEGDWTEVDLVTSAAWIDLPDKHGVVFFGSLGQGHVWYGAQTCVHGLDDPCFIGQGPHASSRQPRWWIYDPADLARVARRQEASYAIRPASVFNPNANHPSHMGCQPRTTGAWFDALNRFLYISCPDADHSEPTQPYPLIHVWRVR